MISNIQLIRYGHSEVNKSVYVYFTWKMHVSDNGILQLVRGEGRFDIKESVAKEYLWVEARFHEFSDTPSTLPFSEQEFSMNEAEFSFISGRIIDVPLRILECIAFHYTPANNEIEIKDDKGIINQLHELISSNDWGR